MTGGVAVDPVPFESLAARDKAHILPCGDISAVRRPRATCAAA
ncbi:hypothetical protein BLL52_1781 [Rhodoferax antarcticus ANT.BR]|uniref:Uncharacterized protein n=1 Tax=Rhodoferax antarcticus ANT.BR TaxID=1111071 RepID=A0A1Q8YGL4_9BURK|nr:hypothetical protein BLL52_1781 [Rhodoferax antarcticus ANT.BR]